MVTELAPARNAERAAVDPASKIEKKVGVSHEAPPMNVLVVDDEEFVRETLADMLTMLGHRVESASGGREALQKFSKEDFDLVFTDLSMPEMDGWELARELHRLHPDTNVILITGHGAATPVAPEDKNIINGVVGKPFDFDQVAEILGQVGRKEVMSNE